MHDMWQKEKSQARSKDPQKPAAYGTDVPFFEKGTDILVRDSFKGMIIYKIIFTCKGNTCLAVD